MDSSITALDTFGPAKNVFSFADGQTDTTEIKEPSFEQTIDFGDAEVAQHLEDGKAGLSFFSQAFNAARRSWHLKVDIEMPSKEISLWIVERGETCNEESVIDLLRRSLPIKFSSQFMEVEIADPGLRHRKPVIFFSFSHDKNQVIGYRNFANINQLANQGRIKIRVKILEHIFHSAVVHHLASIFQRQFKEDSANEQTRRVCPAA